MFSVNLRWEKDIMVNGVNSSTSKLLEQIKRLSTQTNKTESENLHFKNKIMNDRANSISKDADLRSLEKTHKKNDTFTQIIAGIKKEDMGRNIQTSEISKSMTGEKRRHKEPIGNFLDVYL